MNSGSLHIIKLFLWLGLSSMIYFLCLMLHFPIVIAYTLSITLGIYWWYKKKDIISKGAFNLFSILIVVVGFFLAIKASLQVGEKYGLWDAWAIWNLHATYLAHPDQWQNMLHNADGAHPDYPLALPGILAYFKYALSNRYYQVAVHGLHLLITLSIPLLIFLEVQKKNLIIAGIALIMLCTNDLYITMGVSQLADTLLSLFFLIALVCIRNAQQSSQQILYATFSVGLCMWTKNEGIIIAVFILLFYFKQLFNRQHIKHALLGLSLPVFILLIFKLLYATPNDILSSDSQPFFDLLTDSKRYELIYHSFKTNLNLHFQWIKYALPLLAVHMVIKRSGIRKNINLVLAICVTYMGIYLVSPHDLEWHMFTSQSRLMHQLAPILLYAMADYFAEHATIDLPKGLASKEQHLR